MTNIELISDAYRMLCVIDENEAPSAEQGVLALRKLNQMMELWDEEGAKLQYFEQTDQDADFPCAPYTHAGVTAKLAIVLAAHYGISVSPELLNQADNGYAVILRKSVYAAMKPVDVSHLPQGEGKSAFFDITTGNG